MSLLFLLLETLIGIFAVLFMVPLTLWRLPTFIILIKKHNFSKKMLFPVLFKCYKIMLLDLLRTPIKLLTFLICPRLFVSFTLKNAFKYGKGDLKEF